MEPRPYAFHYSVGILLISIIFAYWFFYQKKYGFKSENRNSIVHAIAVLVGHCIFIVAGLVVAMPLGFWGLLGIEEATILGVILGYISFVFLLLKTSRYPLKRHIRLEGISIRQAIYFTLLIVGLYPLIMETVTQIDEYIPFFNGYRPKAWQSSGILYVSLMLIVVPLCEEFIFRGVIQSRVQVAYGAFVAVLTSTVLFSASRLYIDSYDLILGLICGAMVVKTGSIIPVILLRFIFNLFSVLITRLGMFEWIYNSNEQGLLFLNYWALFFSLVLTLAMFKFLKFKLKLYKRIKY